MTTTITEIKVYWDTQDPANEGWAYTIYGEDRIIESGPIEFLEDFADGGSLQEAVVNLAAEHGVDIETGDVATEQHDGGFAIWTRI